MDRPEIVIGLVGALGTDLDYVTQTIDKILKEVGYASITIRISKLLEDYPNPKPFDVDVSDTDRKPAEERLDLLMSAGNEYRRAMDRGDALALLSILKIRELRFQHHGSDDDEDSSTPIPNHAFILRSLKHPDEVKTLREVYGSSFFLISAYSPKQSRLDHLAKRIARSHSRFRTEGYEGEALKLIERDEEESEDKFGQQVRKTFWRGDAYIDASTGTQTEESLRRLIQVWFCHPFHTPTQDEYLMFCARAASYRSASMGRQVGAVIATSEGSIISTGTNEVPKAGGGQYWHDDEGDARDHVQGYDSSDTMRQELLGDILQRLEKLNMLKQEQDNPTHDLVTELLYGKNPIMEGAEFNALIEFQRAVHAEMSAITDAARRGVSISGATMYATTFPCHGCARHIIASGIERVVYIEPYAKSLARTLHSDSISVDEATACGNKVRFEPFVGLAPRRYMELFALGDRKRKDNKGQAVKWFPSSAEPNIGGWYHSASVANEQNALKERYRLVNGGVQGEALQPASSVTAATSVVAGPDAQADENTQN